MKSPLLVDPMMRESDMNDPMDKVNNPLLEENLSLFGVVSSSSRLCFPKFSRCSHLALHSLPCEQSHHVAYPKL